MAKDKDNIETIMKDAQAFANRAKDGMDILIEEKKNKEAAFKTAMKEIDDQIHQLDGLYHSGTGEFYVTRVMPKEKPDKTDRKRRRSTEECEAQAAEIVAFIKAAGKDGVGGGDITAQFGKIAPSVRAFLEKYSDAKIKTTGNKASMRYTV